jgi:general secretion pathway protein D
MHDQNLTQCCARNRSWQRNLSRLAVVIFCFYKLIFALGVVAQEPPVSEHRRFQLRSTSVVQAEEFIRQSLGNQVNFRVFSNPESNRELIVVADSQTLRRCAELIQELESRGPANPLNPANQIPRPTEDLDWQQVSLRNSDLKQIQNAVTGLFDSRIAKQPTRNGVNYEIALPNDLSLKFGWDWSNPVVNVSGPAPIVDQFVQLVGKLDETSSTNDAPSILAYRNASTFSVQRILEAYNPSAKANSRVTFVNPIRADGENIQESLPGSAQVQEPTPAPNDQRQTELLRQLKDSVQVETLPDLGIIILRGRQKEVQELSRIIQELERLSAESQAEVRIVQLEYTRSDSIQKILQTTSADLISGRVGRATITSLGKPNAILLIGWGEALDAITDLIKKLDQPVAADSQFTVFRLKEAEADTLQTSLNTFFQNRDGLGTKVQIVADTRSNSVIVFGSPRDLAEVDRFVRELDVPNYRKTQQARVVKIQNAIASELALTLQTAIKAAQGVGKQKAAVMELLGVDDNGKRVLESGVLDEVQITPNPTNNSVIISGPAESISLVEALIGQLDVAGSTAQIKIFRIEHGDAATLVQMLRSLMPEQTIDRAPIKMASDSQETSLAPLRFSVDTRTNSIIATGSEGDLRIIHALLLRLDEKEFSERRNLVYRLKNAPATDVAQAINNFLRSERQVQINSTGTTSPFEQLEREVIVVPEPIGNRLILSATPRFFKEIEALIEQLDEPPPQVMIQVMIAEVKLEDNREFGIELGLQDSILFDRSLLGNLVTTTQTIQTSTPSGIVTSTEQVIQAASNSPGFNFNGDTLGNSGSTKALSNSNLVGGQGLSNFAVGRINNELGFGGLVLSASSESISALLRALQESRRLEVLSRPQIRTLDNQPAFIQVGQRVPRVIGSTINQIGQTNSIALENVGLILGVTPRISPDGTVVMEVDAERSGLGPESEGVPISVAPNGNVIRSPRVDTTTAQATVSAASGETIILGGLISKKTQSIDRSVPWLSDIPLLGNLFRYDGTFTERSELMIVMTPYVIRNRDDELRLQQVEFAKMNWCLCDVEMMHGSLDGTFNPLNLESSTTQEIYPGQSPVIEQAPIEAGSGQAPDMPVSPDLSVPDSKFEPMPGSSRKQ